MAATPLDRKVPRLALGAALGAVALGALVPGLLVLGCFSEPEPEPSPTPQPPPPRVGRMSDFYTVFPCRIVDTRRSAPVTNGQARLFQIGGEGCDIPASAVAVAATVATLGTSGQGLLGFQSYTDRGSLEISFEKAVPRSTFVVLPLALDGSITVTAQGPGASHFVVDVTGYFAPAQAPDDPLSSSAPPR